MKQQAVFNAFLREGTVLKNYREVLVMLLRLRQCCIHPSLVQEAPGAAFIVDDADARPQDHRDELARARDLLGVNFVERLRARRIELVKGSITREKAENGEAEVNEADECPVCLDIPEDPIVTQCMHVFCRGCIGAFC
jgi:SNF2 family DNA or RNA helicase